MSDTTQTVTSPRTKPEQARTPFKGLTIGKDWRIGADTLNVILYRREVNSKTRGERWRVYGYYSTIGQALSALVDQSVRDTKLTDLQTVCTKIDQLKQDLLKAVSNR